MEKKPRVKTAIIIASSNGKRVGRRHVIITEPQPLIPIYV